MPTITKDEYDVWGHQLLCVATDITTHDGHRLQYDRGQQVWHAFPGGDYSDMLPVVFPTAGEAYRACCEYRATSGLRTP